MNYYLTLLYGLIFVKLVTCVHLTCLQKKSIIIIIIIFLCTVLVNFTPGDIVRPIFQSYDKSYIKKC